MPKHDDADDLWRGHALSKDPHGIDTAMEITKEAFAASCNSRDTDGVKRTARWLHSIADAMTDLVEEHEQYERGR